LGGDFLWPLLKMANPVVGGQSISIFAITVALKKNETAFPRLNIEKRPQIGILIGTFGPIGRRLRIVPMASIRFLHISCKHLNILTAPGETLSDFKQPYGTGLHFHFLDVYGTSFAFFRYTIPSAKAINSSLSFSTSIRYTPRRFGFVSSRAIATNLSPIPLARI
jgi:hypothetical protein